MSGIKTLVRHSSHYITGQACLIAIGLVSFRYFTSVLSVADYGLMEFIQKLALVGTAAGKLGIQHAVLRFYKPKEFAQDPQAARRFYSTGLLGATSTALLAGVVTGAAFLLIGGKGNPASLALLAAALATIRVLTSIFLVILRAEERAAQSNWMNVITRGITVSSVIALFAAFGPRLPLYFAGMVSTEGLLVAVLTAWILSRGLLGFHWFDRSLYREMVAFGLPMLAYETIAVSLDSADRFLIRSLVGPDPLGYYAAANTVCVYIQDLLMVPINMAMIPIYLRLYNTDGPQRAAEFISDSFRLFIMAATCLVAGVAACAPSAIVLLASAKYASSARLIPWIVASLVLYASVSFFNAGLWIEKKTRTMATLVGITLLVKVALNLVLLPRFGLGGAIAASIVGFTVLLGLTAFYSRRLLSVNVDVPLLLRSTVCAALAATIGIQLHLASPAAELAARAAAVLAVFIPALTLIDPTARRTLQQGLLTVRQAMTQRFALNGGA
jgi:O-antigen/teichoic acid export membrane protein